MTVHLVKQGKDNAQAIAYLDDGTMIVVEDGRPHDRQDLRYQRDQRPADLGGQNDIWKVEEITC